MKRLIVILILTVLSGYFCFAQEPQPEAITVRGQITERDSASSTITIRWLQTDGYVAYDEITLYIPRSAQITKGNEQIGYLQLQVGDNVEAKYIDTGFQALKLISMRVVS